MKKIQFTPIEFPQIDSFIHYFIEYDREKAKNFLREKGHEKDAERTTGSGLTITVDDENPIVWMSTKRTSTVVHEMVHAILHIFRNIGIEKITGENEELFAYYVDYAVGQICK